MSHFNTPWFIDIEIPQFSPLQKNIQTDVCIIGAGISGITAAYCLMKEGKKIIIIDQLGIGEGETGNTTAHISNALDDRYYLLEKFFGEEGIKKAAESHSKAIDFMEKTVNDEHIDCDFKRLDGYLFLGAGQDPAMLDQELEASHKAGLAEVRKEARAPLPSFNTGPCLLFPKQGRFHPLKYLKKLAEILQNNGVRIYTKTRAIDIKEDEKAVHIKTKEGYNIQAEQVIVATNTPFSDRFTIHSKQAPYRTYVMGVVIPSASFPDILLWDNEEPYHYVRLQTAISGENLLIVGGEDHKTGEAENTQIRFEKLYHWTKERFPFIGEIKYHWSGQVMEPMDGMAFIGRNPGDKRTFIVTGDSGHGITHGTIAGILLTDLIMERNNPWAELYNPSRKTLKAAGEFLKENLDVAKQFTAGVLGIKPAVKTINIEDIQPDTGSVIKEGNEKIAVYKEQNGKICKYSAICPHLGCIVNWNDSAKIWNCPCHGSRFDKHGKLLNGPATTDLEEIT